MTKGANYINKIKKAGLFTALIFGLFVYGKVAVAASVPVVISNERIERAGQGSVTVVWNTNIPATGRVVYGTERVPSPGLPLRFEGYQKGTPQTHAPLVFEHSITLYGIENINSYFFRPVSKAGDQIAFGKELSLSGNSFVALEPVSVPIVNTVPQNNGCVYFSSYLHINKINNSQDVTKLQEFLNQFEGEKLLVTGVFGKETYSAVVRFQEKYANDILLPWGYEKGTGYVYILTQKKINEIVCNTFFPLTSAQLQEIGDFNIKNAVTLTRDTLTTVKTVPAEVAPISVEKAVEPMVEATTTKPLIVPIKDTGASIPTEPVSNNLGTATVANIFSGNNQQVKNNQVATLGNMARTSSQGLFSLIFNMPENSADLLRGVLNFVFILVLVYITSNIIAHADDQSISIRQIRSRKLAFYSLGTAIFVPISLLLNFYILILPLIITTIALLTVWFFYIRNPSTTDIIILPAKKETV